MPALGLEVPKKDIDELFSDWDACAHAQVPNQPCVAPSDMRSILYIYCAYTVHILCIYCAGSHGYTHLPLCGSRARRDGGGNLAYGELVKILRKRPGGSTAAVMALTKIKKATA